MSTIWRGDLKSAIASRVREQGQVVSDAAIEVLAQHYRLLCHWNARTNLTRVIEPDEAARLHYAESLFAANFIGDARSVLDVGSGAGFPAVPLAVVRRDISVTALEPNKKKAVFLREVKDALALDNLTVVTSRLEDYDWSQYDLITSRALERPKQALAPVLKSLRAGQRLALFCTPSVLESFKPGLDRKLSISVHPIPHTKERLLAIFSMPRDD